MKDRPLSVIVIASIYILVGAGGFALHLGDLRTAHPFRYDALGIELVRIAAVIAGVFMLRGSNWARWLAVAWIAFHVVVGALHGWVPFAIHVLFLAVIAWFLLRGPAARYFGAGRPTHVR